MSLRADPFRPLEDVTDEYVERIARVLTELHVSMVGLDESQRQAVVDRRWHFNRGDAVEIMRRVFPAAAAVGTWFRAVDADGAVWTEGKDPLDVLDRGRDCPRQPVTYERLRMLQFGEPWRPYDLPGNPGGGVL